MNRERNILYKVAVSNENTITEVFVNLLRWKFVRDILLKSIGLGEYIDLIDYEDISTQVTIIQQKRVDIVIENNDLVIYIENKIHENTQLQESQSTIYYESLSRKYQKTKIMLYLIPEEYIHVDKLMDKNNNQNIITIKTYWHNAFYHILKTEVQEANIILKESIDFMLKSLSLLTTKKAFTKQEAFIMFDKSTIKTVYDLLKKIERYSGVIIEKIYNKYKTKFNLEKYSSIFNESKYGHCVIAKDGSWPIFFGYFFDIKNEKYLLSLRLNKSIINNLDLLKEIEYYEENNMYYIAIPKTILEDDNDVIESIFKFADNIIEKYC
ncbi:MAG TPA: PD-(D/E)XK nuclease family protein [Spirochaetales bacterium]|nr:PD-(D/E)XK nuclease family protein [Spirochaetales bacterium]